MPSATQHLGGSACCVSVASTNAAKDGEIQAKKDLPSQKMQLTHVLYVQRQQAMLMCDSFIKLFFSPGSYSICTKAASMICLGQLWSHWWCDYHRLAANYTEYRPQGTKCCGRRCTVATHEFMH